MVAHLLRLRFLLLANSFKRSVWQIVGIVFGGLYGAGILLAIVGGLVALGFAPLEFARTSVVLGGGVVILGWLVLPLILSGIDETLDPARLAVYPIPLRQLLAGLTLAGLVGIPGIVTLIAALATVATWFRSPGAALVAAVCAILAALTCVVGSRAVAAAASGFGTRRRTRELMGIVIFIPIVLLGPILSGVGAGIGSVVDVLPRIADAVAWTPFGAVWAVPADIAAGNAGLAAARFLIALATLAALLVAWRYFLADALTNPPRAQSGGGRAKGLGLLGVLPSSPVFAVAARALTYWVRDPRYARSLLVAPLVPLLAFFYSTVNGVDGILLASGCFVAFSFAMSIYADVSMDSTAFALHVSSGLRGWADRAGRVLAVLSFSVPLVLLVTTVTVAISRAWAAYPALLGMAVGVLLTGLGVASVVSARVVFPVAKPGDNPFKSPPGAGSATFVSSFTTMGALLVLALPEIVLGVVSFVTGSVIFGVVTLVVGIALGGALLVVGIRWGGAILDRRAPDLLQQLMRQN